MKFWPTIIALAALASNAASVDYTYRVEAPQKVVERTPLSLNDGKANTVVYWKGARGVVVCELPAATEVAEVAVTLRKITKWYLMNEVEVSVDPDGSGEFLKPRAMPVPIEKSGGDSPTVDASCTNMTFRIPLGEKAVRVQVVVKTQAWGAIAEIALDDGGSPVVHHHSAALKMPVKTSEIEVDRADCRN